jgi:hypothetical protein
MAQLEFKSAAYVSENHPSRRAVETEEQARRDGAYVNYLVDSNTDVVIPVVHYRLAPEDRAKLV